MSRARRTGLALLLSCASVAVAPPAAAAAANGSDVDIAKAHFATGQAYYEHNRFADAAREFEEAYRLSPRAPLLYNVGKSYDGANDLARALDAYRRFLDAAPADSADRAEVQRRVALLTTLVGNLTLHGAVDGSTVTVDGAAAGTTPLPAPLVVNPGRRALVIAHERYVTFRRSLDVPVGGSVYVEVQQPEAVKLVTVAATNRPEKPIYKRWWLWTAVGGAVVAAGVVTAVVLTASPSSPGGPTIQLPMVQ